MLLLGDPNARKLKRYQPNVSDINLLEEEIAPLSDDELRGVTVGAVSHNVALLLRLMRCSGQESRQPVSACDT